jgi:phosphatidylglycerophosphate synthase
MPTDLTSRRPLKSRDLAFFKSLAAWLAKAGVAPNAISFSSIVFGAASGAMFAATSVVQGWPLHAAWLAAAAFIQLRLIANLLDGMVAVEGRRGGPTGELWNEAPDRVADAFIFIGAGFAAGSSPVLGFAAALLAVFVAYVRALGASVGAGQIFIGPMAKPHRMFAMTVLSVAGAFSPTAVSCFPPPLPVVVETEGGSFAVVTTRATLLGFHHTVLSWVLVVIILGGIVTSIRRLSRIAAFLRTKTS